MLQLALWPVLAIIMGVALVVATGILGAAGGVGGFFVPTMLGTMKQTLGS